MAMVKMAKSSGRVGQRIVVTVLLSTALAGITAVTPVSSAEARPQTVYIGKWSTKRACEDRGKNFDKLINVDNWFCKRVKKDWHLYITRIH
ncbi:hypothetical protein WEH80_26845 [Actinomycetes bacterium KLBMP 9759]